MPLTVNVGVARKLGQPGFSSIGDSCQLAVELDHGLLGDPDALQHKVRQAYAACARAVRDERDRLTTPEAAEPAPPIAAVPERNRRSQGDDRTPDRSPGPRRRGVRPVGPGALEAHLAGLVRLSMRPGCARPI
ncbi:hypothetical protein BH23PLA1_BH23PLA1_18040 [soil metagenome]